MLQTLYNLGPAPEPNLTIWYSARMPDGFRNFAAKVAIDTSSLQFESDEIMRRTWGDDGAIACCVSPMLVGKQMQFFGARANLAKCLLYAINGGRDEMSGKQIGPAFGAGQGRVPRLRRGGRALRQDDGLAGGRVRERHERHPLHARQVRLRTGRDGAARLRAAADDGVRHGRIVGRGRQPVGDQVREGEGDPGQDRPDHRLPDRRRVPGVRQQRQPGRPDRQLSREHVHEQAAKASDVSECGAHAVDPDHHVERRVRKGDRKHAGRPAAGRAVRAWRQSDARARQPRDHGGRGVGGEDSIPGRGGRHFAHGDAGADRTWPCRRGSDYEPHRHAGRLLQRHGLSHERQRAEPGHAASTRWIIRRSIRV